MLVGVNLLRMVLAPGDDNIVGVRTACCTSDVDATADAARLGVVVWLPVAEAFDVDATDVAARLGVVVWLPDVAGDFAKYLNSVLLEAGLPLRLLLLRLGADILGPGRGLGNTFGVRRNKIDEMLDCRAVICAQLLANFDRIRQYKILKTRSFDKLSSNIYEVLTSVAISNLKKQG